MIKPVRTRHSLIVYVSTSMFNNIFDKIKRTTAIVHRNGRNASVLKKVSKSTFFFCVFSLIDISARYTQLKRHRVFGNQIHTRRRYSDICARRAFRHCNTLTCTTPAALQQRPIGFSIPWPSVPRPRLPKERKISRRRTAPIYRFHFPGLARV